MPIRPRRPQLARDFTDAQDLTERLQALYRVSNPEHPSTLTCLMADDVLPIPSSCVCMTPWPYTCRQA